MAKTLQFKTAYCDHCTAPFLYDPAKVTKWPLQCVDCELTDWLANKRLAKERNGWRGWTLVAASLFAIGFCGYLWALLTFSYLWEWRYG